MNWVGVSFPVCDFFALLVQGVQLEAKAQWKMQKYFFICIALLV
jgi:hypothetical protein